MPAKVKFEQVSMLKEKLQRSKAVYIGEYRGMTVAQSTALRAKVREAGGELKVAKNTLFSIALREADMETIPDEMMTGPNVFALCYEDPVAVAKVLKDYATDKTQKAFVLKGGLLGNASLTQSDVYALADLPSREALLAQVVGTIAAPLSGLVNVLSGTMRGLVTCLGQIRDQKDAA